MLKQSPEQVEQGTTKIQEGKPFEEAMSQTLPNYNQPPAFSEKAPCKGLNEKDNNECSKFIEENHVLNKNHTPGEALLREQKKCRWTPDEN